MNGASDRGLFFLMLFNVLQENINETPIINRLTYSIQKSFFSDIVRAHYESDTKRSNENVYGVGADTEMNSTCT
jgi:hypothetical protein